MHLQPRDLISNVSACAHDHPAKKKLCVWVGSRATQAKPCVTAAGETVKDGFYCTVQQLPQEAGRFTIRADARLLAMFSFVGMCTCRTLVGERTLRFRGYAISDLVAVTSASRAEGRQFDLGLVYVAFVV